jgi:hypothetical protein
MKLLSAQRQKEKEAIILVEYRVFGSPNNGKFAGGQPGLRVERRIHFRSSKAIEAAHQSDRTAECARSAVKKKKRKKGRKRREETQSTESQRGFFFFSALHSSSMAKFN